MVLEEKRREIIHKLTLLDTQSYRCIRIVENKMWASQEDKVNIKEPSRFRPRLYFIYKSLSLPELTELYSLRKGDL